MNIFITVLGLKYLTDPLIGPSQIIHHYHTNYYSTSRFYLDSTKNNTKCFSTFGESNKPPK